MEGVQKVRGSRGGNRKRLLMAPCEEKQPTATGGEAQKKHIAGEGCVAVDASHWIPSEWAAHPNGDRRKISHPDGQTQTPAIISHCEESRLTR